VTAVPAGQTGVKVSFQYGSESDKVPYPIPAGVRIEGGPQVRDRHIIPRPAGCGLRTVRGVSQWRRQLAPAPGGVRPARQRDAARRFGPPPTPLDCPFGRTVCYDGVAAGRIDMPSR
jgi:hypothetical protein